VHLVNTFLLLGALALTWWWARPGQPEWATLRLSRPGALGWALGIALAAVLLLGVTGAITALGDTLFPPQTLAEGIQRDFSPNAHFLEQLRVWHPVIAVIAGMYVVFLALVTGMLRTERSIRRLCWSLGGLFLVQLLAGLINLLLLAPVWMQIIHLLLADLVWVALVLLSAEVFSGLPQEAAQQNPASHILESMP
jgi:heme A synthase